MDKVVLAAKLESLRRCVGRIEQKRPCWSDLRAGEPDIQDIIVLNLTRAVQLCVDIGSHIVSDSELPAPQTMSKRGQIYLPDTDAAYVTGGRSISIGQGWL